MNSKNMILGVRSFRLLPLLDYNLYYINTTRGVKGFGKLFFES